MDIRPRRIAGGSLALGLGIALAMIIPTAASTLAYAPSDEFSQTRIHLQVGNASHHAVWVDVSSSRSGQADWTIEKAFCLEHGQSQPYTLDIPSSRTLFGNPQMRIRAEIKHTDCRSSNIRVLESKSTYAPNKVHNTTAIIAETQIVIR